MSKINYSSKFLSVLKALSALIFLLLFTSCFDAKREIKMYPDGSGIENITIIFDYQLLEKVEKLAELDKSGEWKKHSQRLRDNSLLEQSIREAVQKIPGTSIKELSVSDSEGLKKIFLQYSFDDPLIWSKISTGLLYEYSNKKSVSYTTIKFLDDEGKLSFKHTTRLAERAFDNELMNSIFADLYERGKITYSIDFPFEVTETNSTDRLGNTVSWNMVIKDAIFSDIRDSANLVKNPELALTYAEKIDRTIGKVSQSENPLMRVQVYNRNREPVKIGTSIVLQNGLVVTNFELMNIIEGAGYFSILLPNDSLAGIDDMRSKDIDEKHDLVYLRYSAGIKFRNIKYASLSALKYGEKVKIFYYPNTLSSVVYAMDGTASGVKSWKGRKTSIIEIKPSKPISLEGGAVFTEAGDFLGMLTKAYDGEVGKLYVVPGEYIRDRIPKN